MNILIAEDDPVSRAVLAKILAAQPDYRTTMAEDGALAWSLLDDAARSFDVVFLDLQLPKLDGFEVLKRVREAPLLRSVVVVPCTAANDRNSVVRAAQLGARHYIVKPFTAATVMAKLQQLQMALDVRRT